MASSTAHVNLWMDEHEHELLRERAAENERSLSAEVRLAIRRHLEDDTVYERSSVTRRRRGCDE